VLTPALARARDEGAPLPAITIAVGPEGGFEEPEFDAFAAAGFAPVALGRNILRFETAGMGGVAAVRAMLDLVRADPAAMTSDLRGID
jgi:16S rRNA (uracil1498-N3)-methyltransferase